MEQIENMTPNIQTSFNKIFLFYILVRKKEEKEKGKKKLQKGKEKLKITV